MTKGTALITGASSGIGAAYARRLAAEGFSLILQGRRRELLEELCLSLRHERGIRADYICAELADPEGVRLVEETIGRTADLTFLVNNAGSSTIDPFHEETIESQEEMIRVHVLAAVRFAHAALAVMMPRRTGSIVNVASVAAFVVAPGSAIYCAAKGFLVSFSESLHLEVGESGIRVQALCPGFTRSDFHSRLGYNVNDEFFRGFLTAEEVVEASLRDLARGKVLSIPRLKYKITALVPRLLPRPVFYRIVGLYRRRQQKHRDIWMQSGA
jgi:hypothetical protein